MVRSRGSAFGGSPRAPQCPPALRDIRGCRIGIPVRSRRRRVPDLPAVPSLPGRPARRRRYRRPPRCRPSRRPPPRRLFRHPMSSRRARRGSHRCRCTRGARGDLRAPSGIHELQLGAMLDGWTRPVTRSTGPASPPPRRRLLSLHAGPLHGARDEPCCQAHHVARVVIAFERPMILGEHGCAASATRTERRS